MPEPTDVKATEGKPEPEPEPTQTGSPVPATPSTAQVQSPEAAPSPAPVESPDKTYRTTELLTHWPAVLVAVEKSKDAYSSLKQRARIIGWSLNLAEKAVGSVLKLAENVGRLQPVIQYADKAVSEGVVAIEKKFPAVKESPEKLYDAVTQQIRKLVGPTLDKAETISEIGRKKLNKVAKKIVKKYHGLIRTVDSWMDALEKRLNGAEPKAEPGTETAAAEPSAAETPPEAPALPVCGLRQALQLGGRAATALAAFQVGAAFWLLAKTPLVGRFFVDAPTPGSSRPSSSSSSGDVSSSSSSRSSPPAAPEEPPRSGPLSTQSLHPEQLLSPPQE